MKVIISHLTSNQFNRTAVKGLLEEKMRYEFHTAIESFPGSILDKLSDLGPLQEIDRRSFPKYKILFEKIKFFKTN